MKFFKKQTNLKKLTLNLKFFVWINPDELLIHLFGNNLHLKTDGCSINWRLFLTLKLDRSQNATETISAFTKLFPNVKNFNYIVTNEVDHGLDQIVTLKF